ncbi:MAG: hypothetical protein RLZZ241_2536 [Bacteroidota bacterium]
MKQRMVFLYLVMAFFSLGCEEVIYLELPDDSPRLVVEGLVRVDRQEPFIPIRIKLMESSGYFDAVPAVQAENINIYVERFENGNLISTFTSSLAEEATGSGNYIPDPNATFDQRIPTFFLEDEVRFTLQIKYRDRQYLAQTWFVPVVPMNYLLQGKGTLQGGKDTEILVAFTDPPQNSNYYLFDFGSGKFLPTEDTYYQGQFFQFSYFYDEKIAPGTTVSVAILGADLNFYDYMRQLLDQSQREGPFQTPAASTRGNIIDVTGIDNINQYDNAGQPEVFALGYFAVVEQHVSALVIQ